MTAARSRLAVALAALGVAFVACLGGDHGAARAAVGNPTGPLIGSPLAGAAILAANGMAPGDVKVGYINVTNIGDTTGSFALGSTGLTPTPLSDVLDLDVEDVTPGHAAAVVYSGKLASLSRVALGDMAQGEAHRYRFSVSLPSGVDDSYQGASSAVTFMWSATGDEPAVSTPTTTTPATPSTPGGGGTTTPAPAPTADAPPVAKVAGKLVRPRAALDVRARQRSTNGAVAATVTCQAACSITLTGTATVAGQRLKLPAAKSTLRRAGRARMRVKLPAKARMAIAAQRPVAVRLTMKATIGTRVVTVRRTVRVTLPSR
jgi:hypothetical protein